MAPARAAGGAVRLTAAAPRRGGHAARLRGRVDGGRRRRARAIRVRLGRAGTTVGRRRRLADPAATDAPLSLGPAVLHRARNARGHHRSRYRPSAARDRRHRLPRHHGSPRPPRPRVRVALRAAVEHGARGDRRRASRDGDPGAGGAAAGAVGRRAQGARPRAAIGCYHQPHTTHVREKGERRVTDNKPLNVGDQAPAFTLKTIGLKEVSLADYKGKNVVLLFYPLDWTPG